MAPDGRPRYFQLVVAMSCGLRASPICEDCFNVFGILDRIKIVDGMGSLAKDSRKHSACHLDRGPKSLLTIH